MTDAAGTKAEYVLHRRAAGHRCSKPYLSKKDVAERLEPAMFIDPEDGKQKIDFLKADEILAAGSDPARAQPPEQNDGEDGAANKEKKDGFHDLKTAREKLKLEKESLDLEERRGNTLDRQQTADACAWAGGIIREKLQSRNRRVAVEFATMNDALKIRTALDDSDREILQGLVDEFERRLGTTDT